MGASRLGVVVCLWNSNPYMVSQRPFAAAAFGLGESQRRRWFSSSSSSGTGSNNKRRRLLVVYGASQGSDSDVDDTIPSWAKPDSPEPPPWARDDSSPVSNSNRNLEIPFYVYLLASSITAIAAIGSVFEYLNQKPVFGVLNPDSIFYAPLLGFFAFTGIPTSAILWFKSVEAANKEAEEQDRRDGYL